MVINFKITLLSYASHPSDTLLSHTTVKGIYVSWSNDPPNTKIKDWNVTELKVLLALGRFLLSS